MADEGHSHSRQGNGGGDELAVVAYASHEVRLSGRQWLAAGALILGALALLPVLWKRAEPFRPGEDYRIPYALTNDYWFFHRYSRCAAAQGKTLVLGDSVIWGQYVNKDQTLTHCLDRVSGRAEFANMGADGMHPVALDGLVRYYARGISDSRVLLHCNPLWMSSERHDLQIEKEFRFNHPRLVPQFFPVIPCYREPFSGKLAIAVERRVPFLSWANHLRLAYFDQMDIPAWTLEHPYANPIAPVTAGLPSPAEDHAGEPASWRERGIRKQDLPWVDPETSFQWRSFRRLVGTLRARGNRVFVLVGPFNEHMLEEPSLQRYHELREGIARGLDDLEVPHYVPDALPSEYCADASHPLAEGYELLARQLAECDAFVRFLGEDGGG